MDQQKAIKFIKETARPVDLAIYRYLMEEGSKQDVIQALVKYQNPDGGFGHGLEADYWNPNSSPIATNDALITLYKVGGLEEAEEMVSGMLRYLRSHDSFDEMKKCWQFAIESNREYPHAIWWEKDGDGVSGYNPTVSLATFLICYGGRDTYYEDIIREAFAFLEHTDDIGSDSLKCYLLCYDMLYQKGIFDVVDLEKCKTLLSIKIAGAICPDTSKYGKEYVPLPSDFFQGSYGEFVTEEIKLLVKKELEILDSLQHLDGGFDISWQWYTDYPEEFQEARRIWRPRITREKLLFAQMFEA